MTIGKYRIGRHRYGHPWRFRFAKTMYYSGAMTWYRFWCFYLVVDNR